MAPGAEHMSCGALYVQLQRWARAYDEVDGHVEDIVTEAAHILDHGSIRVWGYCLATAAFSFGSFAVRRREVGASRLASRYVLLLPDETRAHVPSRGLPWLLSLHGVFKVHLRKQGFDLIIFSFC